ncbi:hypothetical protein C9374_001242 [Naegleria lovaniensis]|uniref:GATOR1 complex protein NPRL3 C-terminal HTH domain-containing protein n=1 Tax=Naegleria lovaniensis TaxID=51637 RepID=A0AA88GWI8_NAELO|nr:uncharacterized protein C9374_001242 [Naegleria lovaniensis]KAG2387648.1 hypothetical protein C9374_001242 [Naegleria lovaniensis]
MLRIDTSVSSTSINSSSSSNVSRSRSNSIGRAPNVPFKPSSPSNNAGGENTPTATFHHISSNRKQSMHRFRFLQGFPVTALVVVNGIRGQQISFMYPTDEHLIFQQQSMTCHDPLAAITTSDALGTNSSSSNTNILNSSEPTQQPLGNSSTNTINTSGTSSVAIGNAGNISGGGSVGTANSSQHLVSHPQVIDKYEDAFGLNSAALSYLLCPPKSNIIDKSMTLIIDNLLFLSRPASILVRKVNQLTDFSVTNPVNLVSAGGDYTHFTIAFVFPNHVMEDYNETVFSHLLTLLMKSYVREQQRCGYVLDQLNLLGKLKDQGKNWRDLVLKACEASQLAKEIITVVDAIRSASPLQLRVNGWIELGYRIPKRIHHIQERKLYNLFDILSKNKHHFQQSNTSKRGEGVKPYNSCIFVNDFPKLKIPVDGLQELQGNDSILRLFNTATKTIGEVAKDANLSLNFVLSLVQHLVDWGVVRIIPKISYSTLLAINENPDNNDEGRCPKNDWFPPPEHVIHEFSKKFPQFPNLIEVLKIFSTVRSCKTHIENISKIQYALSGKSNPYIEHSPTTYFPSELKTNIVGKKKLSNGCSVPAISYSEQYMMCIIWLLRKGYIKVCNTYYQLVIPHQTVQGTSKFMRPPSTRDPISPSTPPSHITFSPPPSSSREVDMAHESSMNDEVSSVTSSESSSPRSFSFKKYMNVKIDTQSSDSNDTITESNMPRTLSVYEMEYIKRLCDDPHMLELFKKLHVYFNGSYSEREIIHQNNISRDDFKKVVKAFGDVILSYTI